MDKVLVFAFGVLCLFSVSLATDDNGDGSPDGTDYDYGPPDCGDSEEDIEEQDSTKCFDGRYKTGKRACCFESDRGDGNMRMNCGSRVYPKTTDDGLIGEFCPTGGFMMDVCADDTAPATAPEISAFDVFDQQCQSQRSYYTAEYYKKYRKCRKCYTYRC